jgi:DNA-binding transcriptional regulator YdaS (Cro superfamily)
MSQLKQMFRGRQGDAVAAAAALGVSIQCLWNWTSRGVPVEWCARVEQVLNVRRWDLRPKDWYLIWPELIGTEGAPDVPAIAEETKS